MRRLLLPLTASAALALVIAGCGGSGTGTGTGTGGYGSAAPGAGAPRVPVTSAPSPLGTVLVDGTGRTVYLFEKDAAGRSACDGACASIWPPVPAASVADGSALKARLGVIRRADGKQEATYAGHPLYYYAGDQKPGDTSGQDLNQFGAKWYVVKPSGSKIDDD